MLREATVCLFLEEETNKLWRLDPPSWLWVGHDERPLPPAVIPSIPPSSLESLPKERRKRAVKRRFDAKYQPVGCEK